MDNLKEHNYQDLINHLLDFKEFAEKKFDTLEELSEKGYLIDMEEEE